MARKSGFLLLACLLVAAPLFAAEPPWKVRNLLERALDNEREAAARYDAFAQKAVEEGYHGVANLFHAAARAERIHADRIVTAMKARGIEVPGSTELQIETGTTAQNLRTASAAEQAERDGFYREAYNTALDANDEELAKLFDQTRDTEVEHANLYVDALRNLEKMKRPKSFFVCDHCGYTTDLDLPMCVLCRKNEHPHKID